MKSFDSEQVFRHNYFVSSRVYKCYAGNGTDGTDDGNDHEQVAEQDRWRRQLVTCGFYDVHKSVKKSAFFGCVFLHVNLSFFKRLGLFRLNRVQIPQEQTGLRPNRFEQSHIPKKEPLLYPTEAHGYSCSPIPSLMLLYYKPYEKSTKILEIRK